MEGPYDDFTEATFKKLLAAVAMHYSFATFSAPPAEPHVLWRHDVDFSPHRARSLARIESDAGIRATYFIRIRGEFYNAFERPIVALFHEISATHEIGLHYEPPQANFEQVCAGLQRDRCLLEDIIEKPVRVFSFHNPMLSGTLQFDMPELEGLVNVYSREFVKEYAYVTDSSGNWQRPVEDLLDPRTAPKLHVLTHPDRWTDVGMDPGSEVREMSGSARGRRIRSLRGGGCKPGLALGKQSRPRLIGGRWAPRDRGPVPDRPVCRVSVRATAICQLQRQDMSSFEATHEYGHPERCHPCRMH